MSNEGSRPPRRPPQTGARKRVPADRSDESESQFPIVVVAGGVAALAVIGIVVAVLMTRGDARRNDAPAPSSGASSTPGPSPLTVPTQDLLAARAGFQTRRIPSSYAADGPAPAPPADLFQLVKYSAPPGPLSAYVTPDPADGQKHPAVLWAHGGFGGIGEYFWEKASPGNDQSASAFRKAGLVLMIPSWRGENDNPGDFELFYGEVNDLLAARDYLASLPYVDPDRIYLAGHSTGGTLALLAATATDKFRAVFSFGGAPNVQRVVGDGEGYGNTPFDYRNGDEGRLRSPIQFVGAIKTPTFYFEGSDSGYIFEAMAMEQLARTAGAPFRSCIVMAADHFNILAPLTTHLAEKIQADSGPRCTIDITPEEAVRVFQQFHEDFAARRAAAVGNGPVFEVSPEASAQLLSSMRDEGRSSGDIAVEIGRTGGEWSLSFIERSEARQHELVSQGELTIAIPAGSVDAVRGFRMELVPGENGGFHFEDTYTE